MTDRFELGPGSAEIRTETYFMTWAPSDPDDPWLVTFTDNEGATLTGEVTGLRLVVTYEPPLRVEVP